MRRLAALLALSALLGAAQAGHYTLYHEGGMHREMATFEANTAGAPPVNNVNGPPGQETRPIPDHINVYPTFRGLPDLLTSPQPPPGGARGTLILDHHMYGSAVEVGWFVPYHYALARETGGPRTAPTSLHMLWHGWWDDVNGDGVIDDEWCAETGLSCSDDDEFVWRGANTGEPLTGLAWIFPGDYDGSNGCCSRFGGPFPPATGLGGEPLSALSGDCNLYNRDGSNPGCVTPSPDFGYADLTRSRGDPYDQRWAGNNGGGQYTPEEFLLVSQHVVSMVVPDTALAPGRVETAKIGCGILEGCVRDYDWYDSLAVDLLEDLYLSTIRSTPRCSWYWHEKFEGGSWLPQGGTIPRDLDFGTGCAAPVSLPPEAEPVLLQLDPVYGCATALCLPCPHALQPAAQCAPDTRHVDARADGASRQRAYAQQDFVTAPPAVANTPPILGLGPQGFYGYFASATAPLDPESSYVTGPTVSVKLTAWRWADSNMDGYIGRPGPGLTAAHEAGWTNSPNDGACDVRNGWRCELHPATSAYAGARIEVRMDGGWPAGTLLLRDAAHVHWGTLGLAPDGAIEHLSGDAPAVLRPMDECVTRESFTCHTKDALLLPAGSHPTLRGSIPGGVTIRWTEGTTPYAVTFDAQWSAEGLPNGGSP